MILSKIKALKEEQSIYPIGSKWYNEFQKEIDNLLKEYTHV